MAKTVLTVDDSASIRQMVSFTLKSAGYEVVEAVDGMDGLDKAEAGKLSVRGTFNPAAIEGLGAGDAADRTARASEETAKNTKKMTQQLEESTGLAFA